MNNTEGILAVCNTEEFLHHATSLDSVGSGLAWSFAVKLVLYIERHNLVFQ